MKQRHKSSKQDRRQFLSNTCKVAAVSAWMPSSWMHGAAPRPVFPEGFAWGAATSAMQVEGYPYEDGGGRSVWSALDADPDKVKDGSNDLITDDTYHLGLADIPSMQAIGLNSYRLSIGWPRVLPDGRGTPNSKGLAYYDRLLDGLLAAGITPWVTVFHFDYPLALQQKGGWLHEDSPKWLADYAQLLATRFGDRVQHWLTINEPNIFWSFGAEAGRMPPSLKLPQDQLATGMHHLLLGHGLATQAIRANAKKKAEVGLPFAGMLSLPATNSQADIEAARSATFSPGQRELTPGESALQFLSTSVWLDPIYLGHYPEQLLARVPSLRKLATADAMATIHQPLDYLAVNLYFAPHVRADASGGPVTVPDPPDMPKTHYGWAIVPELLYWGPRFLYERYKRPVVITENGMSRLDRPGSDGKVHDPERGQFLRDYLRNYLRASAEGVPLRGYFHWSLLDNWEFASGFTEQFGLIYVDHNTQKRTVKDSALIYREIIRSRGRSLDA